MRMFQATLTRRAFAAACAALSFAGAAGADDRVCRGNLGEQRIDGNLHVAEACALRGTQVDGNITVGPGGRLSADGVRVGGNIQADNAAAVVVGAGAQIEGSIRIDGSRNIRISATRVGGDIQLFGNRGSISVRDNQVGGNLQCKSNRDNPAGGGNRVAGNKEDQCARL